VATDGHDLARAATDSHHVLNGATISSILLTVWRAWLLFGIAACGRIDFDPDPSHGISGLTTCYLMDDDPSRGVVHATDSAYNGTCTACPAPTAGYHDGAYTFAGAQGIDLPAGSAGLVGIPVNTVTAWILAQEAGQNAGFVSKPLSLVDSTNAFKLETTTPGVVFYETSDVGQAFEAINSTGNVLGAWHHVAATWDGTTKHLYVDGALQASVTAMLLDSTLPLELGADIDDGVRKAFYIGDLDEICFWSRALTGAEIAHLAAM